MADTAKTPVKVAMTTNMQQEDERETIQLNADGEMYEKQEWTYVRFEEELEGIGRVQTTLKIGNAEVMVLRSGAVAMRQVYAYGERTEGTYDMGYGRLHTEAVTDHLAVTKANLGWVMHIDFHYRLVLQGTPVGRYEISIVIEEDA